MGMVDSIYRSRLYAVQENLDARMDQAGVSLNFSQMLSGCQSADTVQDTAADTTGTGAAYNTASTKNAYAVSSVGQNPVHTGSVSSTTAYDSIIQSAAEKYNLDPNLIKGVIRVESNFHKDSVSRCGAQGLMQLMPGTAKGLGVTDSFDAEQNIYAGAKYIRRQLDRFGDIRLALAAYNTGPHRVASLNITDPDNASEYSKLSSGVRRYVEKVLAYSKKYGAASDA